MNLKILPSAMNDLYSGRVFYDQQEEGLGDYFFDSLFSDIDSLLLYAGIHIEVFDYHRLLSEKFPYAVYYTITSNVILIYRVLDLRQDPEQIKRYLM